ncbi:NfeD family protein [Camelimonas abortus]|uniref:NfeD family protein n=1 Tax=Camelimonas abortus TaxID=1017184 RepID=A0ABV7LF16_9HYPH
MPENGTGWALLAGGLLLVALEVMAPGVCLLWFGLAALGAGACGLWFDLGWQAAAGLFCAFSVISVLAGRWLTRSAGDDDDGRTAVLNRRAAALAGRLAPLREPVVNGRGGSVRIDDTIWRVTGPDAPAGTLMRVAGVEGVTLVVELAQTPGTPPEA